MLHNQNKIREREEQKKKGAPTREARSTVPSTEREAAARTPHILLLWLLLQPHIGISAAGLLLLSSSSVTFSWYLSFFVALVASNTRARIFKNSTSETTRAGQRTASSGHISRGDIPSLPAAAVARLLYLYLRENSGAHTVHHSSLRSIYRPAGN